MGHGLVLVRGSEFGDHCSKILQLNMGFVGNKMSVKILLFMTQILFLMTDTNSYASHVICGTCFILLRGSLCVRVESIGFCVEGVQSPFTSGIQTPQ